MFKQERLKAPENEHQQTALATQALATLLRMEPRTGADSLAVVRFVGLERAAEVPEPPSELDLARIRSRAAEAKRNAARIAYSEALAAEQRFADRVNAHDMIRPKPARNHFEIIDLTDTVCHWPVTDRPVFFCGAPKSDDARIPYCTKHCGVAYCLKPRTLSNRETTNA